MAGKTTGFVLLLAALGGMPASTLLAQQLRDPPDSTYLRLKLELAREASFSYDIVRPDKVINVHSEIRNVNVDGCMLFYQNWSQRIRGESDTMAIAVPLNAIDTASLDVDRRENPPGERYEPPPWVLSGALRSDSPSSVAFGRIDGRDTRYSRYIVLWLRDYQTAVKIRSWLTDAASRCETWKSTR